MSEQKQKIFAVKKRSKKSYRFIVFGTTAPLLFFGIAYIIWTFLQKPVMADLRVIQSKQNADANNAKLTKTYQGKYLTFSYPGDYQELTHITSKEKPIRENIFLSATDLEGQKIAVVVEERETGNFEESPSFQMRLLKPKEYKKELISEDGFTGFLFSKNTQVFEETAFVRKENFIISVSLSSAMTIEGLNKTFMDILRSLEWHK